jgi:ActR/RegA family two-component response regulator
MPTLEARLARKLIVFSRDPALREDVARSLPHGWQASYAGSAAEVGEFADVLLHRFALLDLEPGDGSDAIETVREIRGEMLLNIPIFCFGGDAAARDAARLARADRFFERGELGAMLPRLCEGFAW